MRYENSLLLGSSGPWIDGPYWTLYVEVQFYALVAALLLLGEFRLVRAGLFVLASVGAVLWFWRLGNLYGLPAIAPAYNRKVLWDNAEFFGLGAVIWSWFFEGRSPWKVVVGAASAAAGAIHVWVDQNGVAQLWSGVMQTPWVPTAIWLLAMLAIVVIVRRSLRRTVRAPAASDAMLRSLGMATYPLYLIHDLVGAAVLRLLILGLGIPAYLALIFAMLAMIGLALIIMVFLEPLVRMPLQAIFDTIERKIIPAVAARTMWGGRPAE
jgi:peptidoglycan/LPS O-acetylase OafA/YrhL